MPVSFPLPAGSPEGRTALGLLIYAAAFALPAAAASEPFTAGLAWSRAADAADPWIARSVVLAADDNLVWTASGGGAGHLDLFSLHAPANAGAPAAPLWRDDSIAAAVGTPMVAAARDGAALFSVAQLPGPTALQRRTIVAGHDPASAVPRWTYDPSVLTNGPARIASDAAGDLVVMALWIQLTSTVEIAWLSGATGARLAHATVSAPNLSQVAVSADGSTTLVSAGLHVWAFDTAGAVVHHEALTASTPAIAISGTGDTFAVGGMGALRVFARQSAGYALVREIAGEAGELSARCALSDDARTLAIGWWRYTNGVDLRCDVWDLALGVRRFTRAQYGIPGGFQNLPEAVRVTPDGSRAAFGCWGDGTSAPDLLLVDVASGTTKLEIDLEGSVHALDLDTRGTRVAVAMKHTHANQLGNTGEIRVYDSGERDLVVFGQPRVGGTLQLAAKRADASLCVFMYGLPRSEPLTFPGVPGALWLKRARLISIPVFPDASRRADLSIAIPADPSLAGRQWHMQAAFRVNGTLVFGDSRVDPLIL